MKCLTCKFRGMVPGSEHSNCSRGSARPYNVNLHGQRKGWFMFPYNFDPIWAEGCFGFVDKNEKELSTMTDKELDDLVKNEIRNISVPIHNEKEPILIRTAVLEKFEKAVKGSMIVDDNKFTKEGAIELIQKLRKI